MKNGLIIFGSMGSGKDTVADMILEYKEASKKYNIGDIIRNIAVATNHKEHWINDSNVLIEFLEGKIYEFKSNIEIFCKEFNMAIPQINSEEIVSKMYDAFMDFKMWEKGTRPLLQRLPDILREPDKNAMNFCIIGKIISEKDTVSLPIVVGGRTPADFEFYQNYNFKRVGIDCDSEIRRERLIKRDGVAQLNCSTHNTERYVEELVKKADIIVNNNVTMEELKRQVLEIITNA